MVLQPKDLINNNGNESYWGKHILTVLAIMVHLFSHGNEY
jgi:hypothetical protein